jgi:hypothetical protein
VSCQTLDPKLTTHLEVVTIADVVPETLQYYLLARLQRAQ